ncbi:hypothetical protein PspS34_18075 [Pseudomonas sp. S34]|nr:hypothetical protein PspS34_18075 [Pseudomonas sp. S34]
MLSASIDVRLSGEDCKRGTFSHRHAVLNPQNREVRGQGIMRLCQMTTPVQFFHLLRYPTLYSTPRLLIVMTQKSSLRPRGLAAKFAGHLRMINPPACHQGLIFFNSLSKASNCSIFSAPNCS